jgi:OmcA/MtrC family decaheme c-type cytochrome
VGNFPNFIHKLHMGDKLVKTGYNFNANGGAMLFNTVGLPKSPANCASCHDGSATKSDGSVNVSKTANGDNWKSVPSLLACGSCHDGINFATGTGATLADKAKDVAAKVAVGTTQTGHIGGLKADNSTCSLCHDATTIPVYHRTNFATLNNPVTKAGVASFAFDLKSVTVNATTGQPTITFQIKKNGVAVTALNVPTLVTNAVNGQQVVSPAYEPITGFAGGPSLYVAYAVPQDGIAAPADFNVQKSVSLTNLLIASGSPKAGSITGPDANGYFVATLTGDMVGQPVGAGCVKPVAPAVATCVNTAVVAAPLIVPAAAKMVTGAIIGSFTQKGLAAAPYVAANVAVNPTTNASGGVAVPGVLKKLVATGYTARRVIVDSAKCNTCHEQLGTDPSFHGGARNDATACAFCHNTSQLSGGWTSNSSTFIHGIHGSSKRTVGYTWQASLGYATLGYPGVLKDCNQCHTPGSVNFASTGGTTVAPNLLPSTVASGTTTAAGASTSPYISQVAGTKYGLAFSYTTPGQAYSSYTLVDGTVVPAGTAGATGFTRPAEATTLVSSPISAACFSCHDTSTAKNHMTTNGGAIYAPRGAGFVNGEACLACHGAGKVSDAVAAHK